MSSSSRHTIALCLACLLGAGAALSACSDNTTREGDSWIDERSAQSENGSIRIANRTFPGSDDFERIGTPVDSLGEQPSAESCFGPAATRDPRVTPAFINKGAEFIGSIDATGMTWMVSDIVRDRFLLEDPATQLELPYLDDGEPVAAVIKYDYLETVVVSPDSATIDPQTYNSEVCGTESEPLTLAEFVDRCGDTYVDGSVMGGFAWIFATHPTMNTEEIERVRDEFVQADRDWMLGSPENISTLVDLGFDVRVYSHGFPDSVSLSSHTPGAEIDAAEAHAYVNGTRALREQTNDGFEMEWPHDRFGTVLGQAERQYRVNDVHACSELGYQSEIRCYTDASYVALSALARWQDYVQTAEQRLRNPAQYDWGYDPEGVRADYRSFVRDVRSCMNRSDGLWTECRQQIDATPTDTDAICSSCAVRFNCDPMASNAERCADQPERERFECDASAFSSEWEWLDERVQLSN